MQAAHSFALVAVLTLFVEVAPARAADTFTVKGTEILKNGRPWCAGGVNSFDQFGPSKKGSYGVKLVRVVVDDLSECPISLSEGVKATSIGYLHPLEEIVNNNRSQGQVTILCPFGWDTGNYRQILNNTPSAVPWYREFKARLSTLAAKFSGQSDVWFDVWNEPYPWDNKGFTEAQWLSDMNDLYRTIRASAPKNIILIPGQAEDGEETVLIHQAARFLRGKTNVAATIHCYNHWTGASQADSEARIRNTRKAGWALVIGEVGPDQWAPDCSRLLNASVSQQVITLAWSWDSGDGDRLVANGTPTPWGTRFTGPPKLKPPHPASPIAHLTSRIAHRLRQHLPDHLAMHIGQAALGAVVVECELLVVQPQEVQHRGVEVVDGADVLLRLVAELVGSAVAEARSDSGAGHPDGKAVGVMIPALAPRLVGGHPTELRSPKHQRILQ